MPITPDTTLLNKYRIVRLLGEGGMARVWLAEELAFGNRLVAIKEPRPSAFSDDAAEIELRYRREVQVCAALEQAGVPNIVRAITAEPTGDGLLLVMAYMPGGDLADLIRQHPAGLPVERAVAIALDVLAALAGAHSHPLEIVHRDIKPSNILFDKEGRAHLADFGLAQLAGMSGRSQLRGNQHPGTPQYMAPEQERSAGYLSPAADLYALGCVLWEMLTGKRYKRFKPGTPPSQVRSGLPAWLDQVIAQALAMEPWERWEEAAGMTETLRAHQRVWSEVSDRKQQDTPVQRHSDDKMRQEALRRQQQEAEAARQAEAQRQQKAESAHRAEEVRRQQSIWQQLGIQLVRIPAGEFLYGNSKHRVRLPEYWLAKTPVTNSQYAAFVRATAHRAPDHWINGRIPEGTENHPVTWVSWYDAVDFCQWAGLRLPTEQEWEKGARGVDGRTYPWGNQLPDENRCNFNHHVERTTSVNQYRTGASPFGLLDMAGNVWEWCENWDNTKQYRVLCGGSWGVSALGVRADFRYKYSPDIRYDYIGFRPASSP